MGSDPIYFRNEWSRRGMSSRTPVNFGPLVLAAVTLGAALQVRDGLYSPLAVALLGATCASVVIAMLPARVLDERWTDRLLWVGLLLQLALLCTGFPGSHHHPHTRVEYWPFL